ncbi:MAG: hypothetical protein M1820_000871 [Bogoriella megaspora]|nr:MAG: hypothetical protein M1820_000871 [Bogoriella megaspora]
MASTARQITSPPTDVIQSVKFSPYSRNRLLVSSWDRHVYLYDVAKQGENLINKFEHRAAVLDACFGDSDNEAFTGGLDLQVRKLNLETGTFDTLSNHTKAVKNLIYSKKHNLLISGSWDGTLHVHALSQDPLTPSTIPLPDKVYTLSATDSKLVVGMASRAFYIYDLQSLSMLSEAATAPSPNTLNAQPWQHRESSLKFLTRISACMPSGDGYAVSSIEGRVAVEWFDDSEESQARKYAFKCHRQTQVTEDTGQEVDVIYPVNALAFHPIHGTLASGGGDGVVAIWDPQHKRRVKQYPKLESSVPALAFSHDGKLLAMATSPGFETDKSNGLAEGVVSIWIKELTDTEAKAKVPR